MPGGGEKKVLIDGRELLPNPAVPDAVWEVWDALPTETVPQRGARPVKRLVALAQALSADGVRPGALEEVEARMHTVLDALRDPVSRTNCSTAMEEIWAVRGKKISGPIGEPAS